MTDQSRKNTPKASEPSGDANTVTINVGPVLAIVALLVVLPVGYLVGRQLARPAPAPSGQAVPAAGAAVPAGNPGGPPAVALDTSGGGAQPAVQEEALQEMSPGQVIPLGESTHPLIGQDAIDVTGVTLDGKKIKLSDYRGKPVMLNFWATWCPPCRAEMPFMQEAYSKFKSQGFEILAVNAGEKVGADQVEATVKGFVTDHAFTFPIMLADDTYGSQARYYVSSLPSTFLVDAEGKVRDSHRGMYPNRATLEDQLVRRFSFKAATN